MSKKIIIIGFLLVLFSNFILSQDCDDSYQYTGLPGDVKLDSTALLPGSALQVDFCAMNVPDRITFFLCNDTISFYVGRFNEPFESDYIQGYAEIVYKDRISTITYPSAPPPGNDICDFKNGRIRLKLFLPIDCCFIKWEIRGNTVKHTDYFFCMKILSGIPPASAIVDSIEIIHCDREQIRYLPTDDCTLIYAHYIDGREITVPSVINPTCSYDSDGQITFPPGYSQYNLYNLDTGWYHINIILDVCVLEISKYLSAPICNLYIPNVFSPNGDGQNDTFLPFSDQDDEYELFIYDRWGGLLHHGKYITNRTGWSPDNVQPGVYVYRILLEDKLYSGSVTVVK